MKKKIFTTLILALFMSFGLSAQRVAVVDINDVLVSFDSYQLAEKALNAKSSEWQQDVARQYDEVKAMYNKYQAEEVLLSESQKIKREEAIVKKEKQIREFQKKKFGPEGELFKLRQQLIRPIQDQIYQAIEDYSADKGFDIVLDKSSNAGVLFTSSKYEKTAEIKKRLGIK